MQRYLDKLALNRNVTTLSLTLLPMLTSIFAWYMLLPLYLRELGATDYQVGITYSLISMAFSLTQILGGFLSARFGSKRMIALPTFLLAPIYLGAGLAHNWYELTLFLILADAISAIQWPAFISMMAESVPENRRGVAFSMMEFSIGLGMVIGPAAGAFLIRKISFPSLLYSTAIISLPCGLLRHIFLEEKGLSGRLITRKLFKNAFSWRFTLYLLAGSLLFMICFLTFYGPFYAIYSQDIIELDKSQISLMFAIGGLFAIFFGILAGKLADSLGSKRVLILSILSHVTINLIWLYSGGFAAATLILSLSNIFFQGCLVTCNVYLAEITTQEDRNMLVGIFGTITGVASALGPYLGMLVKYTYGYKAPFFGAFLLGMMSIFILSLIPGRDKGYLAES